ncbi:MAG TPA: glycoside hydrolase family protein [Rickettsia endosymbiont of Bembidion lapponicum]|nr:glycoside hydrolase family protein [Rickettsia endosymbiont of Bembidion lapponicum]
MFNCCYGTFQASTLRQKLNRSEYDNAADELLRWVKAKGGVKLQGLVKRREIERSLFLSEAATAAVVSSA